MDLVKSRFDSYLLKSDFWTESDQIMQRESELKAQIDSLKSKLKENKKTMENSLTKSLENVSGKLESNIAKYIEDNCITISIVKDIEQRIGKKADRDGFEKLLKAIHAIIFDLIFCGLCKNIRQKCLT